MKTWTTLFFICQNLNPMSYSLTDPVIIDHEKTYTFNIEKLLFNYYTWITHKELLELKTVEEQFLKAKEFMKLDTSLSIQVDETLFNKLSHYQMDGSIEYHFNLDSYTQTKDFKNYFNTNFNLDFNEILEDVSHYDNDEQTKDYKLFSAQKLHWYNLSKMGIYLRRIELKLLKFSNTREVYLIVEAGIDLHQTYEAFLQSDESTIYWDFSLFLNSMTIIIHNFSYDFSQKRILTMTYFYEFLDETSIKRIQTKFHQYLNTYFEQLTHDYPLATFDFDEFWNNYQFLKFNPLKQINKLQFQLNGIDLEQNKVYLLFNLNLIYQQKFFWTLQKNYEIPLTGFADFVDWLKQQITNQGYKVELFNFEIKPNKIIISSKTPELLQFAPVELNYHFLNEKNKNPVLPGLIEDDNSNLDVETSTQNKAFNSLIYLIFLIPLVFLIVYLTFKFMKKFKKGKHKMIK